MKKILFIFILLFNIFFSYPESPEGEIISKINRTEIQIGEIISLSNKLPDNEQTLKDAEILWEEMNSTHPEVEVMSKKSFYKSKYLNIEIVFTFFKKGEYNDFAFTIPIRTGKGEILYLNTKNNYNIKVNHPLTDKEIENIKNLTDPTKIELKDPKKQAKLPVKYFYFIIAITIFIILSVLIFISSYFIYKYLIKKFGKNIDEAQLPPYDAFLAGIATIHFDINDSRKTIEKKLSKLTEILKRLIYNDFNFNAPSETTRELLFELRKQKFNEEITISINQLFKDIDMIKFAKADYNLDKLNHFISEIKNIGHKIQNYKETKIINEKNKEI